MGDGDQRPAFQGAAARWLQDSETVLYLSISSDGRLIRWNPAVPARLEWSDEDLDGVPLQELLAAGQASPLPDGDEGTQGRDDGDGALAVAAPSPRLLNFVTAGHRPLTLSCHLYRDGDSFHIVAADVPGDREELEEQLLDVNRELAVVSREEARRARELTRTKEKLQDALAELENSYWHLKKVQEVLPVCMHCGRIRSDDASWEDVVEYLKKNSIFVSHGLCPRCEERFYSDPALEDEAADVRAGKEGPDEASREGDGR